MKRFTRISERIFHGTQSSGQKKAPQRRSLRLESLEERALLSVSANGSSLIEAAASVPSETFDDALVAQSAVTAATTRASYTALDGSTQYVQAVILNSSMKNEWSEGWYVVTSNLTLTNASVTCRGKVNLILSDNYTLTITGANHKAGIGVAGSNSLTIYCQKQGTGKLIATGGDRGAGIGGGNTEDSGTITINGGHITATGNLAAAGIGGGYRGHGKNITINGGRVIATGSRCAAGIGGGGSFHMFIPGKNGENITINGGHVTAYGGDKGGAGIGGGASENFLNGGDAKNITITGGCIRAVSYKFYGGAGIGGGAHNGHCMTVKITGGIVTAEGSDAGIGGGYRGNCTDVTIDGGFIYARGGGSSAGIGGGCYGYGKNITINGGEVTIKWLKDDGQKTGAGIGGGREGEGENITINGGKVLAMGATGIGGGYNAVGRNITINGGTVTAISSGFGAGIGGGNARNIFRLGKNGENITINGGTVIAKGGKRAAGIGGGGSFHGSRGGDGVRITINGGTVTATGGDRAAGIGGGEDHGHCIDLVIRGGTITAYGSQYAAGIGGGYKGYCKNVTIYGGTIYAYGGENASGIGSGYEGSKAENIKVTLALVVLAGSDNISAVKIQNDGGDLSDRLQGKKYASVQAGDKPLTAQVSYIDENGASQSAVAIIVNGTMKNTWLSGWYVVTEKDLKISNASITCNGDVRLILADGCSLTVWGAGRKAGISVSSSNNLASLTIYGQAAGTGKLNAYGGEYGAGIGGNEKEGGQNITINGGDIYAEGKEGGAGIGGGYRGDGKNITINRGKVNAKGGRCGAGIGGGGSFHLFIVGKNGEQITINGGEVTAVGGDKAAGIGGGGCSSLPRGGDGKVITINGGKVTATGTGGGAGIGGARDHGHCIDLTIRNGIITAYGSTDAAGIGGGSRGYCKNLTIFGGTIYAYGGKDASAIGSGWRGSSSEKIMVSVNLSVKAGENASKAYDVYNSGGDLAGSLDEKLYASITPKHKADGEPYIDDIWNEITQDQSDLNEDTTLEQLTARIADALSGILNRKLE